MPSERFFKLDEDKQNRIMEAAIDEFSKAGLNDASINQIIKEADISRGSFYTYFDDTVDLFGHIFDKLKDYAHGKIVKTVRDNDGDIFKAAKKLVDIGLKTSFVSGDKMMVLFQKLLGDYEILEHLNTLPKSLKKGPDNMSTIVDEIYESMNDLKTYMSKEKFAVIIDMMTIMSMKAIIAIRKAPKSKEQTLNLLYDEYKVMETGIRGGALR